MRIKKVMENFYVVLILLFFYIPMLCIIVYSFNASKTSAVWTGFTLDWYDSMINNHNLMRAFRNSIYVAVLSSALSAVIGTAAALSMDKLRKRSRYLLNGIIYLPIMLPEIISAIALVMFFYIMPINYGMVTMVLSHTTFCIPYIYLLSSIRLKSIGKSVFEAASDLGADKKMIFKTITLPLILPGILTGMLLAAAMSLDDVIISCFVSGPTSVTLPVQLYSMIKLGISPEVNALSTIIIMVLLTTVYIIYLIYKKKITGGKNRNDEY